MARESDPQGLRSDRPTTYGYARVSTADQSTDLQVDALLKSGVAEIFSDDGVSGGVATAERPGFATLAARLLPGDTVVVYSLSRLGRSTVDVLSTIRGLNDRGVTVRSVTETLDTATPMGRMFVAILAAVAEMEREMIVERVNAGLAAARARGTKLGRPRKTA